jgi:hypothetical protein
VRRWDISDWMLFGGAMLACALFGWFVVSLMG